MSETNIFTIYGTDPFLIELKRDEVFSELKKNNFFIREIFFNNDRTFKFESLYQENEASLFSEKKILDLRIYSPITKENTEQFIDFCLKLDQEKSLVLSIYNIDRLTTKKWFKEISKISKVQEVKKVYPNQFRNWVIEQYKKNSLDINEENINLLIEKTYYPSSENKLLSLISSASIVTKSNFVKTCSPELNIRLACLIRAVSIALAIVLALANRGSLERFSTYDRRAASASSVILYCCSSRIKRPILINSSGV